MNKNYIIIGDSITYGIGDYESLGWATLLKKEIVNKDDTYICNNFVHIAGYPGATSIEVLDRINDIYNAFMFNGFKNVFILAIGINDVYEFAESGKNDINDYISNIKKIVKYCKENDIELKILGLTLTDDDEINQLILEYDTALRDYCDEKEITFIPILDLLTIDDLIDGLHPNKDGHQKIFNRIKNYINE
jgi:lysophospholipase L1-like esterase